MPSMNDANCLLNGRPLIWMGQTACDVVVQEVASSLDDVVDQERASSLGDVVQEKFSSPGDVVVVQERASSPGDVVQDRASSPGEVVQEKLSSPGDFVVQERVSSPGDVVVIHERASSPGDFVVQERASSPSDVVMHERASSPGDVVIHERASSPGDVVIHERASSPGDVVIHERASSPGDVVIHERASSPGDVGIHERVSSPGDVVQEQASSPGDDVIHERASSPVDLQERASSPGDVIVQERASSTDVGLLDALSPPQRPPSPPVLVDDSSTERHNEGTECHVNEGASSIQKPAASLLPVVSKVLEAEEQVLNSVEPSADGIEVSCLRESPSPPGAANLSTVNGSESVSAFLPSEEGNEEQQNDIFEEQQPAKRAKTNGTVYSGPDAVSVILGQTAEIVLVLAGMAQMRAGRTPTTYERELATTASQNLGNLVSRVAPNNLVSKESLERMLHDCNMKRMAQKTREDRAWAAALSEAEALANARVEALARAKAEAAARAQAEAEELERRRQAALKAAALAANGPSKSSFTSAGGAPLSSGQSPYTASELVQSPSLPMPAAHPTSQVQMGSQALVSKAGDVPRLGTPEKSMSVNGQSHTPASKPLLGRPPKVRNRARKDPSAVTLFTPEFLNLMQNQAPDPQKAQVTHKQLCLGVQQFIREHIPPISQTLQALPPTYISAPFPCQVCKLIAQDTGSVLVCDSCDEVSHVKCVQPPPSKGASKGDWNCSKCLIASRGGKYPSKYGPIRRGSPNSVKLWPPHDTSESNPEPDNRLVNGSVEGGGESIIDGRRTGSGLLKLQRKASLEIDTHAHQSNDDLSTGDFGSSPHLIVHLVNEPSPRTSNPFNKSSHPPSKGDNRKPFPSGQSLSSAVQRLPSPTVLATSVNAENEAPTSVNAENEMQLQGGTGILVSNQNENLGISKADNNSDKGLEMSGSQSIYTTVEDAGQEARNKQLTPAHINKPETRIEVIESKEGNVDSGAILPGKQAEAPLPIVMEWVGGSIRKAEGKIYYRACSVGGITFSVSDCALFRPETPDVPPYIARLQVLWEDTATSHKWVRVSWCYYPTDIPLAMGRPGITAPDEVYESNHCDNNLVGSIQGPCLVLLPTKYREETERRSAMRKGGDAMEELPPIFLSRWMYDAPKGVFRSLQE